MHGQLLLQKKIQMGSKCHVQEDGLCMGTYIICVQVKEERKDSKMFQEASVNDFEEETQ